jgi:hypothetical protein
MSIVTVPTHRYNSVLGAIADAIEDCEADNGYRAMMILRQAKMELEYFQKQEEMASN